MVQPLSVPGSLPIPVIKPVYVDPSVTPRLMMLNFCNDWKEIDPPAPIARVECAPDAPSASWIMEPEPMVTAPRMVNVWPVDPVPASRIAPLDAMETEPKMVPVPSSTLPLLLTVTALPEASEPVTFNVPALTVVVPVYVFTPPSVHVPAPLFTKLVAPLLSPMIAAIVLLPVFEPVRVRVRVPVWLLKPIEPVLVKFTAPDPDASIVPPEVPTENKRSVETAAPV